MNLKERFEVPVEHMKNHYEPGDHLCIVLIDHKRGQVQQEFRTAAEIVEPKYQAHLRGANAHGASVYVTVNSLHEGATGRTKADIDQIRHVYLDIDTNGPEVLGKVLSAPEMPKPHSILQTSPDKFQVMWSVESFEKAQAEQVVRELAHKFNADQAVWDSARVLRVPGYRNCKLEVPHYVREVPGPRAERVYRPEDFPRYAIDREQAPKFGERGSVRSGGPGNSQSEKDFAYACRQLEKGIRPEVIKYEIEKYRQDKPKPAYYAELTVNRAAAKVASRPSPALSYSTTSEDRSR